MKRPIMQAESNRTNDPISSTVSIGPDVNSSKPPLDKKLYRQILLPNGLRAVLISDTVAIHQNHADGGGGGYYSESSEEEDDDESQDMETDDDDDASAGGDGLREAAAAMVVGVGSLYDPPYAQGMAHFLEHMLFMGTTKFPEENAYSAFLSKHGGSDNAWTESEHTAYYLEISQEDLFPALDMFSQFFVEPLLLEDAVDRELHSIESEFQLSKNSDTCRAEQLMSYTNGKSMSEHPFGKFSWGNLKSLIDEPKSHQKDMMKELWTFYHQYYYAQNMRLVVMGAYSLETLQERVLQYFGEIPALPRESSPLQATHLHPHFWDQYQYESKMASFGPPLSDCSLRTIFRMVPVQERHTLSITWQVPSQFSNWGSKPCDYIAHLVGHEAQGSILSSLKKKSWAFGCVAGTGDGGLENASSHALFTVSFTLSEQGVAHWSEVVAEVYRYIGILRHYCASSDGLPAWIYEELRNIHEVSYRYSDELASDDLVQEMAEALAPHWALPPERLLDGGDLLFDYEPDAIKRLLDTFLTPQNSRVDLMSSAFGRAGDFETEEKQVDPVIAENGMVDEHSSIAFEVGTAGPPEVEPFFGTRFWRRQIPSSVILEWSEAFAPAIPSPESPLSLPPKNPFVPESYALKPLPADDADHPLVHCALKVCVTVGKKKAWFPATATKYNGVKNQLLLTYEDEDEKWHVVDNDVTSFATNIVSPGYEGTLDGMTIKYRVVTVANGKGPQLKYGDESDYYVGDGALFPPIPPALSASRLPKLFHDTQVLKLWHVQDRTFKRPIAELRLSLVCGDANKSALHRACADLLVQLCNDAVTETSYLACVCELGSSIESSDQGFFIRVHGFDDKLLDLFELIFGVFLSFRGQSELPDAIKPGRFEACLELQRRKYANSGMKASKFCSSGRYLCLLASSRSSEAKSRALENIDEVIFCTTISEVLSRLGMVALYHGNVDRSDAKVAQDLLVNMIQRSGEAGLPRKKYPPEFVTKIPLANTSFDVVLPSRDSTEPNSAVEVYFQIGKDSLVERVILDLIAHVMDEPFYDQVRTKDQFGYEVWCDCRWTCGVMGLYFGVVSSVKSAAESVERVERFLVDYYKELTDMSQEDFLVEVVGLATRKLDAHDSLADACDSFWSEISDRRYKWQVEREEVLSLRHVTKTQVLAAYEDWLLPTKNGVPNKRRLMTVQVIGTGDDGTASEGRPVVEASRVGQYADQCIDSFHKSVGHQTWGRIY